MDFFKLSKKNLSHGSFHNLATLLNGEPPLQMIFGWEQREENSNITRNASRSDVLTLLTLLSADAKSAVLLQVPSLIKVEEVHNFMLLHFPRWLCLINGQPAMSLRRVKWSVIYKYQCFYLYDIQKWSVSSWVLLSSPQKSPLWRESAKCQLLLLYSQFSFRKY